MVQHSAITDPNIHEPKGVATAVSGSVYLADGSGSGSWVQLVNQGSEIIKDSGSAQAIPVGTNLSISNDNNGTFEVGQVGQQPLPNGSSAWDAVNKEFDWSNANLQVGDVAYVSARMLIDPPDTKSTTTRNNIKLKMLTAKGSSLLEKTIVCYERENVWGPNVEVSFLCPIYFNHIDIINFPTALLIDTEENIILQVDEFSYVVFPQNPRELT